MKFVSNVHAFFKRCFAEFQSEVIEFKFSNLKIVIRNEYLQALFGN